MMASCMHQAATTMTELSSPCRLAQQTYIGWRNNSQAQHPRYSHGFAVLPLLSVAHLLLAGRVDPKTGGCAQTEVISFHQAGHAAVDWQSERRSGVTLVKVWEGVLMVWGER